MFELIGNLFAIAFIGATLILFGGGIIMCIINLCSGTGWNKFCSILGIILGAATFICMYNWMESILWCMLISGLVLSLTTIGLAGKDTSDPPPRRSGPTFAEAYLDSYCEYELTKAAVKDAIKESRK